MHASETITSQGQIQVLYRMLTQTDPETMRMLDDCIILFGQDNPDGMEMISDWYMRNQDPKKREFGSLPRLYHKYIGHDNNRDSFMSSMSETTNVNKQLFREWYPQIVYNQHQTGPNGMVVFVPPFRDPFNFNYDPLVMTELQEVGMAMHSRLVAEDKKGSGARSAAPYSTWHNGMERSVAYFHNSIGLLTEIIGGPTPTTVNLVPELQLPGNDRPAPIAPRDLASPGLAGLPVDHEPRGHRLRLAQPRAPAVQHLEDGRQQHQARQQGQLDHHADQGRRALASGRQGQARPLGGASIDPALYKSVLQTPEVARPRGYVVPSDQADMPTVVAFLNALIKTGVDVDKATKPFTDRGKTYPAGSYVVRAAQAYRPHVMDMFEPQDHPHDLEYPGGPPKAPYDVTGYTLAYQMGIKFDRILEGFEAPTARVAGPDHGRAGRGEGFGRRGLAGQPRDQRQLHPDQPPAEGRRPVYWVKDGAKAGKVAFGPGAIWIPASPAAKAVIDKGVKDLGIDAYAVGGKPSGATIALKPVRVGLVDVYGGSMPSGWNRWMFEKFEAPFQVVYPQRLDAGDIAKDFDVLVFPDGVVPAPAEGPFKAGRGGAQPKPEDIPAEYRAWLGRVTDDKTLPQIAELREGRRHRGGDRRLDAPGHGPGRAGRGRHRQDRNGQLKALTTKELYIPGSVLRAKVDVKQPLAYGSGPTGRRVLRPQPDLHGEGRRHWRGQGGLVRQPTSRCAAAGRSVRSKLKGSTAMLDVDIGKGKVFVFGPEITQRAQSWGTFKFLFNGMLYGPAVSGK
jgi:hypothetical protein